MSRNSTDNWKYLKTRVDAFKSQSRILKSWEIVDYISSGSFGIVFKVWNKNTREYGALKFVGNPLEEDKCKPRSENDSDTNYYNFKASQKEAEIMFKFVGKLRIVQYLEIPEYLSREFINSKGQRVVQYAVLICMKLYQGYDGNRFIGWKESIDKDLATRLQLGCDIAQALMTFEAAGIYHRDVKPGNILRDRNGRFLLGDVGEAKKENEASSIVPHGTRRYMAPEVASRDGISRARSDYRSDIYSLGIVLYEIFNREIPFLDATGTLVPEAIDVLKRYRLNGQNIDSNEIALYLRAHGVRLPAPQGADDELTEIILKACAYRLEDRYQTAEELYNALHGYAEKQGITLPIVSDDRDESSDPLRPFGLIVVVASLIVVVLLIYGIKEIIEIIGWPPTPTPMPEQITEQTTEPTTKPTMEPTTESTTKPTTEPTTKPTMEPTTEPTTEPTMEPITEPTLTPTLNYITVNGEARGAAGNRITVTVIVEDEKIKSCWVQDDNETDHMRIGYDYCMQALVGKSCSYVLKSSIKKLFEDIQGYARDDGYAIMSGGTVHESINNAITAIKDALRKKKE